MSRRIAHAYIGLAGALSALQSRYEMKDDEMRGSAKLMEMLGGSKGQLTEATMAKAFGLVDGQFILDRWWIKGQPNPDVFWANLRAKPDVIGSLVGQLIKGGLVVEGFPLGKPGVIDMAGLNVSNLPAAIR
jgi:hypothetical protein